MSTVQENVEGLVREIVTGIVDTPADADITSQVDEEGGITVNVKVNPDEVGLIIGREGHIIRSIRTLARAICYYTGERVNVEVIE